jgi:hypothetical protein
MANPLDAFKGLKPWQKGAVVIGGIAVSGGALLYARKKKAASTTAAASPAALAAGTAAATVTDPTTGQSYPADSIDPVTNLPYGLELQEYGSIVAADATAGAGGQTGYGYGSSQQNGYPQENEQGASSGTTATNAQWVAEVESALSALNYSDADIQQGLARYFSSSPQGTAADGTNLYQMMDTAIGEFGPPPSGTYALVRGGPPAGAGSVAVPDVVGRTDLDTAEGLIKAAGLVPLAAGDNATGNKGKVTSQSPAAGSKVTKGSSVTLTYKVGAAGGLVKVPDVIGRTDLDTAEGVIRAAGLVAKASGASGAGNKGSVTSQHPEAGAEVAKGSTVTLTYTVKK